MKPKTIFIVCERDGEGRDLYPGVSYGAGRVAAIGEPLPADFPAKAIKQLLRRGVIRPAEGSTPED